MILSPIFLDIETTGLQPFGVKDGEIIENRIIAIGINKCFTSQVMVWEDEKAMIEELLALLHKDAVLVGYNITNFDIPFITARALKHGLYDEIAIIREIYRIDLMYLVQRYLLTEHRYKGVRYNLDTICKSLGIEVEDDITGADVPELWKKGDIEAIKKHCFADLERISSLFWKLEKLAAHNLKVRYGIQEGIEFGYL